MIEAAFGAADAAVVEKAEVEADDEEDESEPKELRERHLVRPPVKHAYGVPPTAAELSAEAAAAEAAGVVDPYQPFVAEESGVQLFQHEHLSHVSFNIFSKLPVLPLRHMGDLHRTVNQRIVLLVLQSRIQSRYAELEQEHYKRCELDHSDSAREGCTVSTVTVTCEPLHWKYALQVAVEEARRLKQHGLTAGELTRFKSAMMRDSEQLAQQAGFVPSLENLDFVMEHDALGHVVMDQVQGHEALMRLDDVICLEGVNEVARELLGFFAEYGKDAEERDPLGGLTTAIVACVPSTTTDNEGVEVPFHITEQEVIDVLSADYGGIRHGDVFGDELPRGGTRRARGGAIAHDRLRHIDETSGVYQRVLSNGVRVNYASQPRTGSAFLRLVIPGGRTASRPAGRRHRRRRRRFPHSGWARRAVESQAGGTHHHAKPGDVRVEPRRSISSWTPRLRSRAVSEPPSRLSTCSPPTRSGTRRRWSASRTSTACSSSTPSATSSSSPTIR